MSGSTKRTRLTLVWDVGRLTWLLTLSALSLGAPFCIDVVPVTPDDHPR